MGDKRLRGDQENIVNRINKNTVDVREFQLVHSPEVQRIFYDGLMEMIPDTAFRGLTYHPESLLLYAAMTIVSFAATQSAWMTGVVALAILSMRYYYSRRVVLGYLERARRTDMGDMERHYLKAPDSWLWVAMLDGRVVGLVAAVGVPGESCIVELQRMSVDRRYRKHGVGVALGRKLLEFAAAHGFSSVVLGTTAYAPAAHRLYRALGFRCIGVTNGYATPGVRQSLLEWIFYWVRHHHYQLEIPKA